ncbi:endonuclease domain-containing protein [Sphingomonas sp. Xoc002]|uniref:endonuclease domain-containing protein n=1 Tax=Sphingomonas sp. Xoc002 TaxID=2837624 RepID=UPI003D170AF3
MRLYENQPTGTVPRARQLRREASEPERRLLRALRQTYPHLKWRHQAPLGPFFADMLCFAEKLVIEVDGDTHAAAEGYDASREDFMAHEGYRTVRVTNADVMENLEGVMERISFSLREKEGARAAQPCGKDEGVALAKKKGGVA